MNTPTRHTYRGLDYSVTPAPDGPGKSNIMIAQAVVTVHGLAHDVPVRNIQTAHSWAIQRIDKHFVYLNKANKTPA